ncbi:MAG: hypothetical protein ACRDT6_12165 [Micromonosporaceae bacterium]
MNPLVDEFVEDLWYDEQSPAAEEPPTEPGDEPHRAEPVPSFL